MSIIVLNTVTRNDSHALVVLIIFHYFREHCALISSDIIQNAGKALEYSTCSMYRSVFLFVLESPIFLSFEHMYYIYHTSDIFAFVLLRIMQSIPSNYLFLLSV